MLKIALPRLEGFLFLLMIFFFSCANDPAPSNPSPIEAEITPDLRLVTPSGRLREAPAPDAKLIIELKEGSLLKDLGEVSDHTTLIRFGSAQFDEPWLKVQTQKGDSGWIYAREIEPLKPTIDLQTFRQQKYLQSIFGKRTYSQLESWSTAFKQAATDEDVAKVYQMGITLRDSLSYFLETKSYAYHSQPLPDLFWMEKYIPAHVLQLVAEGSVYHLFNNYGEWLDQAKKSQGQQDDLFFTLMIQCYPQDSIEYFYPAWEVQTSDFGGHSLLGKGVVYKILNQIEQIGGQTPLFSNPLLQLKSQMLENITQASTHFWEADSLVKQELDTIIQANWSIFTPTDQVALTTRRLQLDSAQVHGIRFNARAGDN